MSTNTARIRPTELSLPAEGGCWVNPEHQQQHPHHHQLQHQQQSDYADLAQQPQQALSEDQHSAHRLQLANLTLNSSSSDLATPLTPTFSHHGGNHLRYASSTSSLDLQQSFSSTCSDSPVSPAQQPQTAASPVIPATAAPTSAPPSVKRLLPDVQEEPLERDENDCDDRTMTRLTDDQFDSLYDCLCMCFCIPHWTRASLTLRANRRFSMRTSELRYGSQCGLDPAC